MVLSYFILMSQPAHPHVGFLHLSLSSRCSLQSILKQMAASPTAQMAASGPRTATFTSPDLHPSTRHPYQLAPSSPSSQFSLEDHPASLSPLFFLAVLDLSCGMQDLSSWTRTEARPPALGAQTVSCWSKREVPRPTSYLTLFPNTNYLLDDVFLPLKISIRQISIPGFVKK